MQIVPYYLLDLSEPPRTKVLASIRTEHYSRNFRKINPCFFEFSFQQEGTCSEMIDGVERNFNKGDIHIFVHDRYSDKYSHGPVHHHFTAGFFACKPLKPMTAEDVLNWEPKEHEAILPESVHDPKVTKKLEQLVKKAVREHRTANAGRFLKVRSLLYEMCSISTEYAITHVHNQQRKSFAKENRYCRMACAYISENLNRRITVDEIARHVNLSYGYLSSLFSQVMGITLIDYINRTKLQLVEQLILDCGFSLEEAGCNVGIEDPKYLSRLFRRYTGMTVSEYRQLHK